MITHFIIPTPEVKDAFTIKVKTFEIVYEFLFKLFLIMITRQQLPIQY